MRLSYKQVLMMVLCLHFLAQSASQVLPGLGHVD